MVAFKSLFALACSILAATASATKLNDTNTTSNTDNTAHQSIDAHAQHPHPGWGTPGAGWDAQPQSVGGGNIPSSKECYPLLCPYNNRTEAGMPDVPDDLKWLQEKCVKVKGCNRMVNEAKCTRYCDVLKDKFEGEMGEEEKVWGWARFGI